MAKAKAEGTAAAHYLQQQVESDSRKVWLPRSWSRGVRWVRSYFRRGHRTTGYLAAVVGTAATTLCIRLITSIADVNNLSLLYLIVVLWVATWFSRGPALAAAVLSFLMYDYFFVPPLYSFAFTFPSGYVSLAALLLAGLVTGQLATRVRERERLATETAQRISTLYALTQSTASADAARVPLALTQQLVDAFAPQGVRAATLYRPAPNGSLQIRVIAYALTEDTYRLALDEPIYAEKAEQARQTRAPVAFACPTHHIGPFDRLQTMCVPLCGSRQVVGVLELIGTAEIFGPTNPVAPDPLFTAYRDQLALALERHDLQQEAIQAAAQRESTRLKEAFLAAVTHDLQTPLSAIQTIVESAQQPENQWTTRDLLGMLALVGTSARRLIRLVDNLLALSRLEADSMPAVKSWYPIDELIATVREQLDVAGLTAGRELVVEIQPDIVLVPLDHAQMERVLINLLENALKYSPPGSPVFLTVRTDKPDSVEIRVRDKGIGIPAPERQAIFEKFYRLSPFLSWEERSSPRGTGLGLTICASIIRAHGGSIEVQDIPDESGTVFVVTLPRSAQEAGEMQQYEEAIATTEACL